jgi:hypothetical protein
VDLVVKALEELLEVSYCPYTSSNIQVNYRSKNKAVRYQSLTEGKLLRFLSEGRE